MSAENLAKFNALVASDSALAIQIQAIHAEAGRQIAGELAALSAGIGTPFTQDEFLANLTGEVSELSDDQLETVAGGTWKPNAANILSSIFGLGMACAIRALASAGAGDADGCQFSDRDP